MGARKKINHGVSQRVTLARERNDFAYGILEGVFEEVTFKKILLFKNTVRMPIGSIILCSSEVPKRISSGRHQMLRRIEVRSGAENGGLVGKSVYLTGVVLRFSAHIPLQIGALHHQPLASRDRGLLFIKLKKWCLHSETRGSGQLIDLKLED